ncbi:MFS transporter [Sphingobium sp.]|uniref:MFS transporter n=1 Tax=Sphingobium sp. TaxID=1912891 RepID=UPI0028BD2AEE|nr:MFS transporter [Sphingobium sp.]
MDSGRMSTLAGNAAVPWYRTLSRRQWNVLLASNLGWLFDGFENYALILTAAPALKQLLPAASQPQLSFFVGLIMAINLLGWGIGGLLGGIAADYIGRKRMMMAAILGYSIMTGLSAFAFSWWSFAILRFLVGMTVGSEWAIGSSMVAEIWPDRARGKGAGLMQCGLGVGFFIASFAWLFLSPTGPSAWRYMYLLGVVPALLTLWIRRSVEESEVWKAMAKRRENAKLMVAEGGELAFPERQLARFTLVDLLSDRESFRTTCLVLLMSLATTVGFWSVSTWVPQFVGAVASSRGHDAASWASFAGMAYTAGSITGYVALGFLADALGRKPVTLGFYIGALAFTPLLFFGRHDPVWLLMLAFANAIFSNGQYTWMAVWLPELYPTRIRATAMAFVFNSPRFLAFVGPIVAGSLITALGGYGWAAMTLSSVYLIGVFAAPFLPETRGKPLPA